MLAAGRARWEALCRAVTLSLSPFARGCPLALPGSAQAMCRTWLEMLREEWWEGTGCQLGSVGVGLGWAGCTRPL